MFRFILSALLCGFLVDFASADLVFQFGQGDYRVRPNQTVNIDVFLFQGNPTGDPVDLATNGLISGGVQVLFNDNSPIEPAFVASLSDIMSNSQFDDTLLGEELFLDPGMSAGLVDGVDDFSAPLKGASILLGTFRFTAGGRVGDITNLIATDLRATDDLIAGDARLTPLDSLTSNGHATITVTAIPEPLSAVLVAVVLTAYAIGVRLKSCFVWPFAAKPNGSACQAEPLVAPGLHFGLPCPLGPSSGESHATFGGAKGDYFANSLGATVISPPLPRGGGWLLIFQRLD